MNLYKYISTISSGSAIEKQHEHRIFLATLVFSIITIPVMFILGIFCLIDGMLMLGTVLVISAILVFSVQVFSVYKNDITYIKFFSIIQVTLLALYLTLSGGRDGTGYLWTFFVPNLTYFVVGMRHGSYINVFYLAIIGLSFYGIDFGYDYAETHKSRYYISYTIVSLMAAGFEFSRSLSSEQFHETYEKYKEQARTDPLTNLFNRNGFNYAVEKIIPLLERNEQLYGILILDLDSFKKINDEYGHSAGDMVISTVADVLRDNLRGNDIAARWGGEEFLVFLPLTDEHGACHVAQIIRKKVEGLSINWKGSILSITVSIGVAIAQDFEFEKLVSVADKKLYKSKKVGGNKVIF